MGFFSWKTQDTNQSIPNKYSNRKTFRVYMIDNKGHKWVEDDYEGYGRFGGKDFYELLAEMNGVTSNLKGEAYTDYMRGKGIDLAFKNNSSGVATKGVFYPNLIVDVDGWRYKKTGPESDENQGYFYDGDEDEEEQYENDYDEDEEYEYAKGGKLPNPSNLYSLMIKDRETGYGMIADGKVYTINEALAAANKLNESDDFENGLDRFVDVLSVEELLIRPTLPKSSKKIIYDNYKEKVKLINYLIERFGTDGIDWQRDFAKGGKTSGIKDYLETLESDQIFDLCNDFYYDDEEWHEIKNDLDKDDLIQWAYDYCKKNKMSLEDLKDILGDSGSEYADGGPTKKIIKKKMFDINDDEISEDIFEWALENVPEEFEFEEDEEESFRNTDFEDVIDEINSRLNDYELLVDYEEDRIYVNIHEKEKMADGGQLKEFNLREIKSLSKDNQKYLADDNGNSYIYENGVLYDVEITTKPPYFKKGSSHRMSKIKVNIMAKGGKTDDMITIDLDANFTGDGTIDVKKHVAKIGKKFNIKIVPSGKSWNAATVEYKVTGKREDILKFLSDDSYDEDEFGMGYDNSEIEEFFPELFEDGGYMAEGGMVKLKDQYKLVDQSLSAPLRNGRGLFLLKKGDVVKVTKIDPDNRPGFVVANFEGDAILISKEDLEDKNKFEKTMAKGGDVDDLDDEMEKLVDEHVKEAKKNRVKITNLGWSQGDDYIVSKTTERKDGSDVLTSEISNGVVTHDWDSYKRGGKLKTNPAKFRDKIKAITKKLTGTKVPKKYKKDYGATYDKKEANTAAKRIAGAKLAEVRAKLAKKKKK